MPAGRPSMYNVEIATKVCEELALGKSLRTVCAPDEMPSIGTIFKWLYAHPEFVEHYARAKEEAAEIFAEDLVEISDCQSGDVQRDRLRIDTRKWIASKLKPKKYGDKLETTHLGDKAHPLVISSSDGSL
jgi:hypothetical protein